MKRFLLYSEDLGVYLGNMLGMGFWSKLDPIGQATAVTFGAEDEAHAHAATWDDPVQDLRVVACDLVREDTPAASLIVWASIEECVAAGLPSWDPDAAPRFDAPTSLTDREE